LLKSVTSIISLLPPETHHKKVAWQRQGNYTLTFEIVQADSWRISIGTN
jgi:hypothetical protein